MQKINEKKEGDRPYISGLNKVVVGLYAPSLAAAKQKAIEHFKPKKKERNLIWVELARE